MRFIRIVIEIETESSDEELHYLVQGIDGSEIGIGSDSDGKPVNEKLVNVTWQEL